MRPSFTKRGSQPRHREDGMAKRGTDAGCLLILLLLGAVFFGLFLFMSLAGLGAF